jgi:hypothetical protein
MKTSELIAKLQELLHDNGDLDIMVADEESGYSTTLFVERAPDAGFIVIGQSPYIVVPPVTLDYVLKGCSIDHWTWNPEHVAQRHGDVLARAGVTDFNAWVTEQRKAAP